MHGCFPSLFSIAFPPGLCVLDATELTSKTWVAEAERLPKRRVFRDCAMNCCSSHCYAIYQDLISLISHLSGRWDQTRKLAIYFDFEWIEIMEIKRTWFRCNIVGGFTKLLLSAENQRRRGAMGAMGLTVHGVLGFQICVPRFSWGIMSDGSW